MNLDSSERSAATAAPTKRSRRIWTGVLLLGLAYFLVRGPVRTFERGGNLDFQFIHNAIQTFQEGYNPYVRDDIVAVAEAHRRDRYIRAFLNATLLYPPPFLALFYPIGLMEHSAGVWVWLAMQFAAAAALAYLAARLAGLEKRHWRPAAVAVLFCAPLHTNIAHGQPGIFFCLLTAVLFWYLREKRTLPAGVALGLLMIKPSFGVPALVPAFALGACGCW